MQKNYSFAQYSSTSGKISHDGSLARQRLRTFISDNTRTTVPFHDTRCSTDTPIIQDSEQRIAKELKIFNDIFNKTERASQ